MKRHALLTLLAGFLAVLAYGLSSQAAHAAYPAPISSSVEPTCHAATDLDKRAREMIQRSSWTCEAQGWRADREFSWLRFDAQSWESSKPPRYFFSRIARYETITFYALDADNTLRERHAHESDAQAFAAGPVFQLELPRVTEETRAVLVRIERAHSVPLLTEARLAHEAFYPSWPQIDVMLLAFVIGMLTLPLLFDISFFVVLRERFVLLHAGMVGSMMVYVMFAGGLVPVFLDVPMNVIAILGPLSFAISCGLSALFLVDFLEEDALPKRVRQFTRWLGWWTMLVPGVFALQLHALHPLDDRGYFLAFLSAIGIVTAVVLLALLRGSQSARFIAVAWTPIILASCERMMRGFGIYVGPSSLDQLLYLAAGFEVVVISLAIASRFLAIRRERDEALTEAKMLESLSERDPLTGLMNRRAVSERFASLRSEGFDTLALVDLDKFKEINDRFGHQVGDQVLVACARALVPEIGEGQSRDSVAVRIGGEEFVVLLKGKHTLERAEAMRQAISVRIAKEVDGLDRIVTGSMGVVVLPRASIELTEFDEQYERADQLLYQAKASGRNRMCYERLTVFNSAPPGRRPQSSPKPANAA